MGLRADGIISGINTSQLVTQLGQLYGRPQAFLKNKVTSLNAKKGAYSEMNTLLASVKTSLTSINTTKNFRSNSVKTSDTAKSYFSVTADGSAIPGSYQVSVESLARAEMQIFDLNGKTGSTYDETTDTIGENATLTINWDNTTKASDASFDSDGTTISISSTDTIQEVATALNDVKGIQSYLLFDGSNYQLVVQSEKSGLDYGFSLSTDNGSVIDPSDASTTTTTPQNAKIKVNGVEVQNSTNAFTGTVPGLTINAIAANAGTNYDITVALDTSAIQEKVKTFVTNYNKAVDYYNARNTYNSETGAKGVFFGDATTRNVMNRLNQLITNRYGSNGYTSSNSEFLTTATGANLTLDSLSTIGISMDTKGKLSLNSTKFNTAVLDYQDDVEALFSNQLDSGSEPVSFSNVFNAEITTHTLSLTGTFASVSSSIENQVKSLNKQISRWDERIANYEARLLRNFTAMEQASGQFQSTGAFLTNFFG